MEGERIHFPLAFVSGKGHRLNSCEHFLISFPPFADFAGQTGVVCDTHVKTVETQSANGKETTNIVSKPFDETLKHLLEAQPSAWLDFVGVSGTAEVIDADLSTLAAEADKVLRVTAVQPSAKSGRQARTSAKTSLLHLEFQSSYDAELGERTLLYNVLLLARHKLPVRSVVILLRKKADGPRMTESVVHSDPDDGEPLLLFRYRIVRLWERSVESLLAGALSILPLALLAAVARADLPEVVRRMSVRLRAEATPSQAQELWSAAYILMGLKYDSAFATQLLKGVQGMEDSVTYQDIIRKGKSEGKAEEARSLLMRLGSKRYGTPDAATQSALDAILSLERLELLVERLLEVESWQELLRS